MFRRKIRSALLIDFDNVVGVDHVSKAFGKCIKNWLEWLEDGCFDEFRTPREIIEKRVYWNEQNRRWSDRFEDAGFHTFTCQSEVLGKTSAADMMIALDAQQIAYENKKITEFIVLTTDTDFVPLLNKLSEMDRSTVAVANPRNLSYRVYSSHADRVISTTDLRDALSYVRPRGWWRRRTEALARWRATRVRRGDRRWSDLKMFRRSSRRDKAIRKRKVREAGSEVDIARLQRAAAIIAEVGKETPGLQLSQKTVRRLLRRDESLRFYPSGRGCYLGCGDYETMLKRLVTQRPDLRFFRFGNGGVAIGWREPD